MEDNQEKRRTLFDREALSLVPVAADIVDLLREVKFDQIDDAFNKLLIEEYPEYDVNFLIHLAESGLGQVQASALFSRKVALYFMSLIYSSYQKLEQNFENYF